MEKFTLSGENCISLCSSCIHRPQPMKSPRTNLDVHNGVAPAPHVFCKEKGWFIYELMDDDGVYHHDIADCDAYTSKEAPQE